MIKIEKLNSTLRKLDNVIIPYLQDYKIKTVKNNNHIYINEIDIKQIASLSDFIEDIQKEKNKILNHIKIKLSTGNKSAVVYKEARVEDRENSYLIESRMILYKLKKALDFELDKVNENNIGLKIMIKKIIRKVQN